MDEVEQEILRNILAERDLSKGSTSVGGGASINNAATKDPRFREDNLNMHHCIASYHMMHSIHDDVR